MNDFSSKNNFFWNFALFFLTPFFLVWIVGCIFLLNKGYSISFLELNKLNNPLLDVPMLFFTMFADGGFMICLLILIFISKNPLNIILLIATIILSGLLAQLLKNFIFNDWHRPSYLFKEQVHTVGSYILNHKSFPSGHSASSAAIFSMIALIRTKFRLELIFWCFTSLLVGYTRVYLGVHFLGDVLAGLIIGLISTIILINIIKKVNFTIPIWLIISLRITSIVVGLFIFVEFFIRYYL